ncbi:MAG: AraC family ligand binding domain-containing protein, partial [Planctomycetes bacterium]|nr:AraC family ligand binding domain-containing protein [Planctomycetota bacterium]
MPRLISAGRFSGSRDCPWHAHEGHEIVLVESGSCSITCGDAVLECPPGSLAILPRGLPQYQRSPGPVRTCYAVWQSGDGVLDPTPRVLRLAGDSRPAR